MCRMCARSAAMARGSRWTAPVPSWRWSPRRWWPTALPVRPARGGARRRFGRPPAATDHHGGDARQVPRDRAVRGWHAGRGWRALLVLGVLQSLPDHHASGASWVAAFDQIMSSDPSSTQATFVAVNPANSNYVLVGCDQPFIWSSTDAGATWTRTAIGTGGDVRRILFDPRTAANPATTVVLAATPQGVFRSSDGGASWTSVLAADVTDLAASFAAPEAYYASVWRTGLFFATNPTGT